MSLYTLYRPKDWDAVLGQQNIVTILRTSLQMNTLSHAYIFTGSRGTGKTTSARIFAKGINCTNLQDGNPCHSCNNCRAFDAGNFLDVIEMDGASNRRIDDARDLIEKAKFKPTQGKYKIYIIDEVHMFVTEAFNALLKTLEEPPDHVKFILATTDIDAIPETIRSRVLRFDFRKIEIPDIIKRLEYVVAQENIEAEPQALQMIAQSARGALRDALTILEQNTINKQLSTEYVKMTLSLVDEHFVQKIISAMVAEDMPTIQDCIQHIRQHNIQPQSFFDQILYKIRDRMIETFNTPEFYRYTEILAIFRTAYASIRYIPDGMLLIELTLLQASKKSSTL